MNEDRRFELTVLCGEEMVEWDLITTSECFRRFPVVAQFPFDRERIDKVEWVDSEGGYLKLVVRSIRDPDYAQLAEEVAAFCRHRAARGWDGLGH